MKVNLIFFWVRILTTSLLEKLCENVLKKPCPCGLLVCVGKYRPGSNNHQISHRIKNRRRHQISDTLEISSAYLLLRSPSLTQRKCHSPLRKNPSHWATVERKSEKFHHLAVSMRNLILIFRWDTVSAYAFLMITPLRCPQQQDLWSGVSQF